MQYPNLFKRIIPFALALGLGLFLASFFVTLTPVFRGKGRFFREMKEENRALRVENERLRAENDELKKNAPKCDGVEFKNFKLYKEWETAPAIKAKVEKRLKRDLERLEKIK